MFSIAVDEYVKMEGKWESFGGPTQYHANFLKAKRHCSLAGNCFGVTMGADTGSVASSYFPVRLIAGGNWYINKKESIAGDFINQEPLLVMNACNKLRYDKAFYHL